MNLTSFYDRYFIKQPRFRRLVTSLAERDCDLDVEIAGAKIRINSRREHGYLRASRMLRRNGTLRDEIPVLMNLFTILKDGDTFIDVGANTGLYTHAAARLSHLYKQFQIISIEAHPDTFSRLSSRQYEHVKYLNLAMSDSAGELEFIDGAVSHVFTALDKQNCYNIAGETIMVQAKRLDDLESNSNSVVLKIDVEGQELRVLQGASQMLTKGSIRAIYLDGYDDASVNEFLIGYGFRLYEGRSLKPATEKTFSLLALKE
mgnify:CR=1 FL=1